VSDELDEEFAVVELMGHRQRYGRIREVERFGTKMLRIDIPTFSILMGELGVSWHTEFYGGASIYAIRPMSEEMVMNTARQYGDHRPVAPLTYQPREPLTVDDVDRDAFGAAEDEDERPF
jgi:hypothetical protein